MATCENCGHQNCGFAQYAARYGAETPARLRTDCERRAKERALAEVARLTATIARVREACKFEPRNGERGIHKPLLSQRNALRAEILALSEDR